MKVKIRRNDLFMEGTCVTCGAEFPPDLIVASAYSDDGSKSYGEVCPQCVYQGPERVRIAIDDQIQSLRDRAERLVAVANDLEQETRHTLELPTWVEWRKAHLLTFLKQINMADDEKVKAFRQTVQGWSIEKLNGYVAQDVDETHKDDPYHQALYAVAWHERDMRQEQALSN